MVNPSSYGSCAHTSDLVDLVDLSCGGRIAPLINQTPKTQNSNHCTPNNMFACSLYKNLIALDLATDHPKSPRNPKPQPKDPS